MKNEFSFYKRKFNSALQPILFMLVNRKFKMTHDEWMALITRTKLSVTQHPEQFLEGKLPADELLNSVIEKIFEEFINEQILT